MASAPFTRQFARNQQSSSESCDKNP